MGKKFYITTPLYYPSGKWHLGHSYTTVLCDAVARFKRAEGFDVFYLTGTDEHGQKIADSALNAGKTEMEYVDGLTDNIKELWKLLNISYDKFIRTTDGYHKKSVQKIFDTLLNKGDIYKGKYKGKYCKPCEAFWTDSQLIDGKCPDCGRDVIASEEECYFFKLSKYAQRIEDLLTKTDFLQPSYRVNEMVNNFIKPGLNDLAVSRTSVKWGIPVSSDPKHVVYVWIDALSNYINALGYNNGGELMEYWPADVHMVGKEIVRFHTIIWPALLMALDLPVPKKVYGHGWLTLSGDKMSKSKGNVQDPFMLCARYGVDAVRYYLLREIPMGHDAAYSLSGFLGRINTDLVNDLGNLIKRTIAMANQYFKGEIKKPSLQSSLQNNAFIKAIDEAKAKTAALMERLDTPAALEEIFNLLKSGNKYIDENTPWILFKSGETEKLNRVLYDLLEACRVGATLLKAFIPQTAERIFSMLNLPAADDFSQCFYGAISNYSGLKEEILYNRIDVKKELEELEIQKEEKPVEAKTVEKAADIKTGEKAAANEKTAEIKTEEKAAEISIDDFDKCELVCAYVEKAEKVEKADKLLKLSLDLNGEKRTVVSGIAKHYAPEELVGKTVVLIKNLKPIKLRGIESHGMVLCATDGDSVVLIEPSKNVKSGSRIS